MRLLPVVATLTVLLALGAGRALSSHPDAQAPSSSSRRIALTFDDLPVHGPLPPGLTRLQVAQRIIEALARHGVQEAYGFLNAKALAQDPTTAEVLQTWRAAGLPLANHAYSHMDLHANGVEAFEQDILANEPTLRRFMGDPGWRWFRFPYLREGDTAEKYAGVRAVLSRHGYRVAQVTVNFDDYAYNEPWARCAAKGDREGVARLEESFLRRARESLGRSREAARRIAGRDIAHVMLLHIGGFQTVMLPRLLDLLREEAYTVVGLDAAQADDVYGMAPRRGYPRAGTLLDQLEVTPPPAARPDDDFARLGTVCAG